MASRSFADRRDAGRRLAARLFHHVDADAVVVALPRGGVPVAAEVARALHKPLEILGVRKIGAPGQPELAVGAVAEGGVGVLDEAVARDTGMTPERLDAAIEREEREPARRVATYRGGAPPLPLDGRTAVIVDDGLATGLTDLAALRAVRAQGARRVVVAAPVGSAHAVAVLTEEADEVVCVIVAERFGSVGQWYRDFSPTTDDEVLALLAVDAAPPTVRSLRITLDGVSLSGDLTIPDAARGIVVFAHGSGSSRLSPRNREVATALVERGFATLLFDLLTAEEAADRANVFDIPLLGGRLESVARWAVRAPGVDGLPLGLFGASTGAAAALHAAAEMGEVARAVVSRGGRPDLAEDRLGRVTAPTLLIVGGDDHEVERLNRLAATRLGGPSTIAVVPHASHLFEELGALDAVTRLAGDWFASHLSPVRAG